MNTIAMNPRIQEDADEYDVFAVRLKRVWRQLPANTPLFTTNAEGLFDRFLRKISADRRQHYNCRCCRTFVDRFGGLVWIDEKGLQRSAMWSGLAPSVFQEACISLYEYVSEARVTGIFLNSEPVLGTVSNVSSKGVKWDHMHVVPYAETLFKGTLLNASQATAEKLQDYGALCRGLDEFPIDIVRQAFTMLTNESLFRSEKCVGVAKWLFDLHEARNSTKNNITRDNVTWFAVATAPPGYSHIRSTMIGTLLEDIQAGKSFAEIKRSFDAKMNPLQYQRPQAAPTDGQLAAAEKTVAALGLAGSLARRFATLEDVAPKAMWLPTKKAETPPDGVFGHLKKTSVQAYPDINAPVMSWCKFERTVLPTAERIELYTPSGAASFFGFVTAADPDAPPIIQWDRPEARNPVSWYLYGGGSMSHAWNLPSGKYVDVECITKQPNQWDDVAMRHQGAGAYFVLKGAWDVRTYKEGGIMLFPEILNSEFHGIRAAIEAYSKSKTLSGNPDGGACGICIQNGAANWNQTLRVTSHGSKVVYKIDRWD